MYINVQCILYLTFRNVKEISLLEVYTVSKNKTIQYLNCLKKEKGNKFTFKAYNYSYILLILNISSHALMQILKFHYI